MRRGPLADGRSVGLAPQPEAGDVHAIAESCIQYRLQSRRLLEYQRSGRMRLLWWLTLLPLLPSCIAAQAAAPTDPVHLLRDLRTAIQADSLATAAELAGKLDDAVQQRYSAWLIRDADLRIDEALAWLPADTESIWVNQQPFMIRPEQGIGMLSERPNEAYSLDRLAVLNDGEFYRDLGNCTVRLLVAGARNIRATALNSVPAPVAAQDVAYVYFFAEPVDLGAPGESIQGRPVWRAIAKIDAGEAPRPGEKRAQRDDENWLALARPDVLILTNRHALLADILERLALGSKARAMPANLPARAHVDRSALFWGLRRYTDVSKAKQGEQGSGTADLPHYPDGRALGMAVRFDPVKQQLQVVYLSPAQLLRRKGAADLLKREFQVDQLEPGVWQLVSDIQARGPFPVHFALIMLGFGVYRLSVPSPSCSSPPRHWRLSRRPRPTYWGLPMISMPPCSPATGPKQRN